MWDEFQANISTLGVESEQLLHDLFTYDETKEVDLLNRAAVRLIRPSGPTETEATVKVRRGQQFFRQSILNAYDVSVASPASAFLDSSSPVTSSRGGIVRMNG